MTRRHDQTKKKTMTTTKTNKWTTTQTNNLESSIRERSERLVTFETFDQSDEET